MSDEMQVLWLKEEDLIRRASRATPVSCHTVSGSCVALLSAASLRSTKIVGFKEGFSDVQARC